MATGSRRQSFVSRFGGSCGSNLACVILKNCCSSAVSLSVTRRSAAGATNSARASHIASKLLAANLAAHGILTKSSLRCAVSLICSGGQCDQHGAELDILLQKRRDKAAAKRFFNHVLAACADAPGRIVTDQLRSYPAAKADIPELANVKHVFVKAAARANNRAENSHQPTRERERRMRGFRDPKRTQAFLSSFGLIR
ncbi:hypothetical protein QFZ97_007284 [Paraburkholderia youngii]